MRLLKIKHKIVYFLVQPGFLFQFSHIIGIRHEAHIENQIRFNGDAMLKSKRQHIDIYPLSVRLRAE